MTRERARLAPGTEIEVTLEDGTDLGPFLHFRLAGGRLTT
jgi:hypothetical protein